MELLVNAVLFFIVILVIKQNIKYMVRIKTYYLRGIVLFLCWPVHFVFCVFIPAIFYKERRKRLTDYDFQLCVFIAAVNGEFLNSTKNKYAPKNHNK